MKKLQNFLAVTAMILLILIILITSFQIAIYGDDEYAFYEKEYEKYQVTESLDMEMEDVMYVTEKMMAYLIGEEPKLSVMTTVEGEEQDFFNEQDRLHMEDVKNLFLGGLKLRTIFIGIVVAIVVILFVWKADVLRLISKAYFQALAVCAVITFFIGAMMSADFTGVFTLFHEMFFTNDLWIFDPRTDYMIRMLPEGFFFDMVVRIGVCFGIGLVLFSILAFCLRRCAHRHKEEI